MTFITLVLIILVSILYFLIIKSFDYRVNVFIKFIFYENYDKYIRFNNNVIEFCKNKQFIKLKRNRFILTHQGYNYYLKIIDFDFKYSQLFCIVISLLISILLLNIK